jgi:GNAT superfamily N-acetyltransferase
VRIRFARPAERDALEALQRESSLVWEEYRAPLLAHPDAIELPIEQIRERRVRVAEMDGALVGFSALLSGRRGAAELDGLFVAPALMRAGIGRQLVADAVRLARGRGARSIEVTANPRAEAFYVKVGFVVIGRAETRFGPASRMRLRISAPRQPRR